MSLLPGPCINFCLRLLSSLGLLVTLPDLLAQVGQPHILWNAPQPITYPTPISPAQYDLKVIAGPPVPVPLEPYYNVAGITTAGATTYTGGLDNSGWAYASELLGNSVAWEGVSFPVGPANQEDIVSGGRIALPAGTFGSLYLLGDLVNGQMPPTANFVITYSDGSTSSVQQSMSDWVIPKNYPGESLAVCLPYRYLYTGTVDPNSTCVYGYKFALDPSRTVANITLPGDRNVVVLSMVLVPPVLAGPVTGSVSLGDVLSPGRYTLTATFQPEDSASYANASASEPLTVMTAAPKLTPIIDWPTPAPLPVGSPLGPQQLNAQASVAQGIVQVPLAAYYRINAMYPDGAKWLETGFDGTRTAFSANQLGTALVYARNSFQLGPLSVPDAASSSTVPLPSGQYKQLYLIGAAGTHAEQAQPFTVTYTDGTTTTANVNLSSWRSPENFAGETIVARTSAANRNDGSQVNGNFDVYGYTFALDPSKAVQTLTLPPNTDVVILAAGLETGTSLPVLGTFTYNPAAGYVPKASMELYTTFQPHDAVDFTVATGQTFLQVGILDFNLQTPWGSTLRGHMGDAPSFAFTVAPTGIAYAANLTFSVTGSLPPQAHVTFSPETVAANAGPQTVTLTVHTRLLSGRSLPLSVGSRATLGISFCALLMFPFGRFRRRAWLRAAQLTALTVIFVAIPVGCGTGYNAVTYPLMITATDGTTVHSVPFTLQIGASPQ